MIDPNEIRFIRDDEIYTVCYENTEACMARNNRYGDYIAYEKEMRGNGYGISPFYHRSTRGDFKRCKKAFEKYSPKTMQALRG
jgi:hypothetical protein